MKTSSCWYSVKDLFNIDPPHCRWFYPNILQLIISKNSSSLSISFWKFALQIIFLWEGKILQLHSKSFDDNDPLFLQQPSNQHLKRLLLKKVIFLQPACIPAEGKHIVSNLQNNWRAQSLGMGMAWSFPEDMSGWFDMEMQSCIEQDRSWERKVSMGVINGLPFTQIYLPAWRQV